MAGQSKKPEPDFITKDGVKMYFDLDAITKAQYDSLFDSTQSDEDEAAIMAAVTGGTVEDINGLSLNDWKRLFAAFLERVAKPIDIDPKA